MPTRHLPETDKARRPDHCLASRGHSGLAGKGEVRPERTGARGVKRPARVETDRESTNPRRPIDLLLSRLERVRRTAPNRWVVACPAHQDRSPSLSVRETPGGTVLIRCFAGCDTQAVLDAVGLAFADLFPDNGDHRPHSVPPGPARIPASDLLLMLEQEALVVGLVGAYLVEQKPLSENDWQRLAQAVNRITTLASHIREYRR